MKFAIYKQKSFSHDNMTTPLVFLLIDTTSSAVPPSSIPTLSRNFSTGYRKPKPFKEALVVCNQVLHRKTSNSTFIRIKHEQKRKKAFSMEINSLKISRANKYSNTKFFPYLHKVFSFLNILHLNERSFKIY